MKKLMLLSAFSVFAIGANAQYDQGRILITGGFDFGTSSSKTEFGTSDTTYTSDGPTTSSFGLNVFGGYFVADNFVVGLGLGFSSTKLSFKQEFGNTTIESTDKFNITMIAPGARYYVPYTDRFALFGEAMFGFGFGSFVEEVRQTTGSTTETTTTTTDVSALMIGLRPGFSYMLTDNVALEMRYGFLGYNSMTMEEPGADEGDYTKNMNSSFGLNLDLTSIIFGISVLF